MVKFWLPWVLFFLMTTPLFAQEQVADHYSVRLGLMSWQAIQAEMKEEAHSWSAYQHKMAKQMAEMHGGGVRGDYHILVTIDDLDSGQSVKDAEVRIVVTGKDKHPQTATLERMIMDGFVGYGGYVRYNFAELYTLRIAFNRPSVGENGVVVFSNPP